MNKQKPAEIEEYAGILYVATIVETMIVLSYMTWTNKVCVHCLFTVYLQ